jgi:hypothetical protein
VIEINASTSRVFICITMLITMRSATPFLRPYHQGQLGGAGAFFKAWSNLLPSRLPNPVQASQPPPACYAPLLPTVMSLRTPVAQLPYNVGLRSPTRLPSP